MFTRHRAVFRAVFSRDVNNYFALPMVEGDKVKRKGIFSLVGGDGHWPNNPRARVCTEAVIRAANVGMNPRDVIRQHIYKEENIDNFSFRRVGDERREISGEQNRQGLPVRLDYRGCSPVSRHGAGVQDTRE